MALKILKKYKILGKVVTIRMDETLSEQGLAGYFDPKTNRIHINPKVHDVDQTFVHELCHAIIHRAGINQIISRDAEEMICENIANVLLETLLKGKR